MKLNKTEFSDILSFAEKGIARTSAVPEMLNFNFKNNYLSVYNGFLFITIACPLENLSFSVPAKKFIQTINSMSDVFYLEKDNNEIIITTENEKSNTQFGLTEALFTENIIDEISNNITEELANSNHKKLPNTFLTGINLCMFSAAKSTDLGTLSCLEISGNYITSSDNLRISNFKLSSEMDSFLLPVSSCKTILTLKPLYYVLNENTNMVYFMNEKNIILAVRVIKGHYPNYKKIIYQEYKNYTDIELPKNLFNMVNTVSIINQEIDKELQNVMLFIKPNEIEVSAEDDIGWASCLLQLSENLDIEDNGFSVVLLTQSLLAILKYTRNVRIITEKNRIMFISDNFRHVLPIIKD